MATNKKSESPRVNDIISQIEAQKDNDSKKVAKLLSGNIQNDKVLFMLKTALSLNPEIDLDLSPDILDKYLNCIEEFQCVPESFKPYYNLTYAVILTCVQDLPEELYQEVVKIAQKKYQVKEEELKIWNSGGKHKVNSTRYDDVLAEEDEYNNEENDEDLERKAKHYVLVQKLREQKKDSRQKNQNNDDGQEM